MKNKAVYIVIIIVMLIIQSIQFFIYLRAELNSQCPITESARIQTTVIRQHRTKKQTRKQRKMDQLRLFELKHDLLKISIDWRWQQIHILLKGSGSREQLTWYNYVCSEWEHEGRLLPGQRGRI
jgi:hypothetical protein